LFRSKEKHLKQGEKISNLENASFNLIHIPLTICKRFLKRIFQKSLQNKTSGANVVQNFNKEENHPCTSIEISILVSTPSILCTYFMQLVQLCTFIYALVCVGINHQKGGD
jgi:hypothetical protein